VSYERHTIPKVDGAKKYHIHCQPCCQPITCMVYSDKLVLWPIIQQHYLYVIIWLV